MSPAPDIPVDTGSSWSAFWNWFLGSDGISTTCGQPHSAHQSFDLTVQTSMSSLSTTETPASELPFTPQHASTTHRDLTTLHVDTGHQTTYSDDLAVDRTVPLPSSSSLSSSATMETLESKIHFTPKNASTAHQNREERATSFVLELHLKFSEEIGTYSNLKQKQKERAMNIQSEDYTWSPNRKDAKDEHRFAIGFEEAWEAFLDRLSFSPELKIAFSGFRNVFFDKEAIQEFMAIRHQLSGICSAHSSVLFQHYVESKRRKVDGEETNHEMLDISSFIRKDLPADKQIQYILKGTTGLGSFGLIKLFTDTEDGDYVPYHLSKKNKTKMNKGIKELYQKCVESQEPGLVSCFRLSQNWYTKAILQGSMDENWWKRKCENNGKKNITHALVLIGAYKATNGRYWFLLQNTHLNSWFKVVDGEHMASCSGSIYFAKDDADMKLCKEYKVIVGEFIETEVVLEECAEETSIEEE